MGKELELLQKMDLTAENRQKLEALITEAKKTGKVSSKHLVETLDDVDATQDQTERFYDILEQAGIEIDVSDVLDLIGTADMDNPTLSEMQAIEDEGLPADLDEPEALPEDVENAKLDDPVRMYLKEIGRIKLLLLAGLLYMLCYTVFSCTAQHGGEIRSMTLRYGDNQVPVRALYDTGCTLRDPMTGERVLVADADALRALLPDASITPAALADPAELLLRLKTRAPALPARLLSYKCVGTQAGLILCLRCEIQVRPGVRKRCLAAFSPTPVSDGGNYDALIGGTIG